MGFKLVRVFLLVLYLLTLILPIIPKFILKEMKSLSFPLMNINWFRSFSFLILVIPSLITESKENSLQWDSISNVSFSRYNYTDIIQPYDGTDAYVDIRLSHWLNPEKSYGFYYSFLTVGASPSEFWWQRYVEPSLGFQLYPFNSSNFDLLKSVRLFSSYSSRCFYDLEEGANSVNHILRLGTDYYYDNLFREDRYLSNVWFQLQWKKSYGSSDESNIFSWCGNWEIGPKFAIRNSIFSPYFLFNWSYTPTHQENWWENYLRAGIGVKVYPFAGKSALRSEFLNRFNIFIEVKNNILWLADDPSTPIRDTDYRIGIAYSSNGFFRMND